MALSSFASYDSPEAPPLGIASTNEGDDNLDDDFDQAEARAAQTSTASPTRDAPP